ncbi:MAG TPA: DUF1501 domain-containing protein [Kofleriaceae bacterium]|nr:DUF1501 domain-containing protein [Kofleriaceae bacterium]
MAMFTRRDVVLGGLAGAAALSLPRLRVPRADEPRPARNLLIVLAAGGWDTTYALDPKPGIDGVDVPAGAVTAYGDLDLWTDASRPAVTAFFDAYAAMTAVVRGISIRSIAHPECKKRMLTGTASSARPDLGAICAHELGRDLPLPYLILGDEAFTGPLAASAGRVGLTNQITALLDPAQAYPAPSGAPYAQPAFVPSADDEAAIRSFVSARAEREKAVRGALGYNRARIDDFLDSLERSDRLRPYAGGFGGRGRNLKLEDQAALAAQVVEQGISRAVMLDSRLQWDTHTQNEDQSGFHDALFASLHGLLDDLAARPGAGTGASLLDETVVVAISEMSRTPRLNAQGGKDHWPVTSMLVMGAGVRGSRALGGTTDSVEAASVDLATGQVVDGGTTLQTENVIAGLLELVGVEPNAYLPGVEPLRGLAS